MTLGILAFPDQRPLPTARTGLRRMLNKVILAGRYKRNARSPEYMRALAQQVLGSECELIEAARGASVPDVSRTAEIVLLWPDGNGFGWLQIERAVFARLPAGARVHVLNGRRRHFELTRPTLASFRARRVLERLWIGEIILTAALLFVAPVLVVWDWAHGRR